MHTHKHIVAQVCLFVKQDGIQSITLSLIQITSFYEYVRVVMISNMQYSMYSTSESTKRMDECGVCSVQYIVELSVESLIYKLW